MTANWTLQEEAWKSDIVGDLTYTIGSLDQNTSYDVQVRAKNDEGTGDWSESGVGMTIQNHAPVFEEVSPITVAENSTGAVVTVSATDADAEDSITGYGIVDGADGSQFSIVKATGVLSFDVPPNYEAPTDVAVTTPANDATDNEYIVFVEATSGEGARALTATQTITVTVTDVDEPPAAPAAPTIAEATLNSLTVSWRVPTNTGPSISAYDVRYILNSATDKADDANWTLQADAWTSGSLEYTIGSLDQNTSYDVQVRAENAEGMSAWSDTVVGMTAQNQAPVFAAVSPISVEENSTGAIVTVSATDDDEDDSITGYGIVDGGDGSHFSITNTGALSFKVAPEL